MALHLGLGMTGDAAGLAVIALQLIMPCTGTHHHQMHNFIGDLHRLSEGNLHGLQYQSL